MCKILLTQILETLYDRIHWSVWRNYYIGQTSPRASRSWRRRGATCLCWITDRTLCRRTTGTCYKRSVGGSKDRDFFMNLTTAKLYQDNIFLSISYVFVADDCLVWYFFGKPRVYYTL